MGQGPKSWLVKGAREKMRYTIPIATEREREREREELKRTMEKGERGEYSRDRNHSRMKRHQRPEY